MTPVLTWRILNLLNKSTSAMPYRTHAHPIKYFLVVFVAFGIGLAGSFARSDSMKSDETRLRAIVAEQVAAWNIGDAKEFSASFAEDGSYTNIRGSVFYGHQAFEDRHVEILNTFFKDTKLAMSVSKVRFVRPDVAIADIVTEISELHGKTPPGVNAAADGILRTRLQEVFVKTGGEWRIASYHKVDVKVP